MILFSQPSFLLLACVVVSVNNVLAMLVSSQRLRGVLVLVISLVVESMDTVKSDNEDGRSATKKMLRKNARDEVQTARRTRKSLSLKFQIPSCVETRRKSTGVTDLIVRCVRLLFFHFFLFIVVLLPFIDSVSPYK